VEGTVEGDMHADKSVFVKDTAKVHGNIFAPTVSIQEGASFSGSIDMDGKAGHAAVKPDAPARSLRASGGAA
jgi:cytoskeletal protein CcmA (bactofilin family)